MCILIDVFRDLPKSLPGNAWARNAIAPFPVHVNNDLVTRRHKTYRPAVKYCKAHRLNYYSFIDPRNSGRTHKANFPNLQTSNSTDPVLLMSYLGIVNLK
jgi:hypothetical protein